MNSGPIGLLWYDASKRTLAERVSEAAQAHARILQSEANYVEVSESDAPGQIFVGTVLVRPRRDVSKNHMYVWRLDDQETRLEVC